MISKAELGRCLAVFGAIIVIGGVVITAKEDRWTSKFQKWAKDSSMGTAGKWLKSLKSVDAGLKLVQNGGEKGDHSETVVSKQVQSLHSFRLKFLAKKAKIRC